MRHRFQYLAITAATLAVGVPAYAKDGVRVALDSGIIAGSEEAGVLFWKGIPFAAPPVGALRWRAPQPVAPWPDVRQATDYGHDCMQVPFPSDAAPLVFKPRPPNCPNCPR